MKKLPQALADAKKAGWSNWIKSEADERAVLNGCRFDEHLGQHACNFFETYLHHSKGRWGGRRFELADWQRNDLLMPLFGWVGPDGARRYRKAYVEIPKKNGKSTIASGIGLYMLSADGEPGAEIYSAAGDEEQAKIVHTEAVNMVDASKDLQRSLRINRSTNNIAYPATRSFYRALTKAPDTKEGFNAHCVICDELHIWKGRELWDALKYAFIARRQGLLFIITTAGADMESVCRKEHEYAKQVLAGEVVNQSLFALIYAAPIDADVDDPQTWRDANPSMGVTMNEVDFEAQLLEAKKSATDLAVFKRYRLNVWQTSSSPWLRAEDWLSGARDYKLAAFEGLDCWAGLDLSKTTDTTSLVLAFPLEEEEYYLLPFFWLPEEVVHRNDETNPYRDWHARGFLFATPGNVVDYAFIKKHIGDLTKRFEIKELAYDPYNAEHLTQEIEGEYAIPRFAFAQTTGNFAGPTGDFERLVLSGELTHPNHPILNWQAGHVQVKTDANGNKRPVKPKAGDKRKIDGIVASIMALARAMKVDPPGAYDERGFIAL